jgi:hypothetical protein
MHKVSTLEQRWWLDKRVFRIAEDGVHVSYQQLLGSQQFRIPFENIPSDTVETTKRYAIWLALSVVFICVAVVGSSMSLESGREATAVMVGATGSALAGVCTALFFFTRQSLLAFATGDGSLVLFSASPTQESVSEFMGAIVAARDAYLKTHYQGPQSGESPIDAIERLQALKEREVISQEEFDTLKARIVGPLLAPDSSHSDGTYL